MEIRPIISAMLRNKTAPLLIAAQVALTLAIIANALYIIRDRLATSSRPTGADEQNLFEIRFFPHRPIADIKGMQMKDLEILRAIPGVVSAAWTNQIPLGQSSWNIGGLTTKPGERGSDIQATYYFSGESIVDTFDLKLIEGRDFEASEVIDNDPRIESPSPKVMIITQALAKLLYPDATSVIGKTFYLGGSDDADPVQIVGVVERLQSPSAPAGPRAENSMIAPIRYIDGYTRYSVRTEPGQRERVMAEAEKALIALSSDRVLLGKRGFDAARASRYSGERIMAGLLIAVTSFLLLITASGIVGIASLWVNQRRKQIGVRRALGGRRFDILSYFLTENAIITTLGIVAGLILALALNRFLVGAIELPRLPFSYLMVGTLSMWVLGLLAVSGPAWRAAQVSPAIATRSV
jgi:putative ABC transport system permease protein